MNGHKLRLPLKKWDKAISDFNSLYDTAGGLDKSQIKIEYTDELRRLLTLIDLDDEYDGLVFHYGFDPTTKQLSYFIGLGKIDSNRKFSAYPLPKAGGGFEYIEVSNASTSIQRKDIAFFDKKRKDYYCQVTKDGVALNLIPSPYHARMVFHKTQELRAFDAEYASSIDPYLYIDHGARKDKIDTPTIDESRDHTPLLRFGNQGKMFEIDDVPYENYFGYSARYRNKAFNIGQLCPPDCGTVSVPAPTCP
ncbi:hypothetical protein O3Q51_17225 [Cryomorphaceae bacterium 1068]|nr:hypothetical protein [Cryomorphaceae bacterium 1068]